MAQSCTKVFHLAIFTAGIEKPRLAARERCTLIQISRSVMMSEGMMKLLTP